MASDWTGFENRLLSFSEHFVQDSRNHRHKRELECRLSLRVERCREDDVPLDQRRRLVHLLVQDRVADDSGAIFDVAKDFVKTLDGANDDALLSGWN